MRTMPEMKRANGFEFAGGGVVAGGGGGGGGGGDKNIPPVSADEIDTGAKWNGKTVYMRTLTGNVAGSVTTITIDSGLQILLCNGVYNYGTSTSTVSRCYYKNGSFSIQVPEYSGNNPFFVTIYYTKG